MELRDDDVSSKTNELPLVPTSKSSSYVDIFFTTMEKNTQ